MRFGNFKATDATAKWRLLSTGMLAAMVCTVALAAPLHAAESPSNIEFFEKRVRPVLVERCYECHSTSAKKLKGGLLLDNREGWSKGGDSGPALVPGDPEKSLLIKAVRWADEDTQMPPKNKLPDTEIAALVEWVKMDAPDPRIGQSSSLNTSSPQDSPLSRSNHWAYQPVAKAVISRSVISNQAGNRTDSPIADNNGTIDAFIVAKLTERGV